MARGLQSGLDDPWLYVDLDTFPARLPPYRPDAQVLQRMVAGQNAAVAAVVDAGNDILLELVAQRDNPGASLVLNDLFERLSGAEILVVCLWCSKETALQREAERSEDMQGLVQRDYENIDQDCCDALLDTDALRIDEQVSAVRRLLTTGSSGGVDQLRTPLRRESAGIGWTNL